jgi:hypothetical protein
MALAGSSLVLTACSSSKKSPSTFIPAPPPSPATVTVSGTLDSSAGAVDAATVKSVTVASAGSDIDGADATSDAAGAFSISVPQDTENYMEFSKSGFATVNSPLFSAAQNVPGVTVRMLTETEAASVISTAFGGMMLSLADKAWLAIDVLDATGSEISGVFITSNPLPDGGGALFCDGSLTGANVTAAFPPCNPARLGPMYLAYYDAAREVSVTASGSSDVIDAPVRVGEVTFFTFAPMVPPPTGGGGGVATGTLTVETEIGGSVTSNPAVLQCNSGNTCAAEVPLGTIVTLIGTPDPGNVFDDWDGCDQETTSPSGGSCTRLILDTNFIRAEFDPAP